MIRRLSVRWRITLVAAGLFAVALGLASFVLVREVRSNLVDSIRSSDEQQLAALAAQINGDNTLPNHFDFQGRPPPGTQYLLQTSGGDFWILPDGTRVPADPRAAATARRAQAMQTREVVESAQGQITLTSQRSLAEVDNTINSITDALIIGFPALVLLVGLLAWYLAGRALRPVEAIRAEAASITGSTIHRRVPVPASGDEVSRLAVTMNQMLDRLEDAQLRQREFVADASHELQSPVAAIRAQLEVARAHPDGVDWPELAGGILADCDETERLLRDLLFLARHDEVGGVGPVRPLDLDDLVLEEAARLRPLASVALDTRNEVASAIEAAPFLDAGAFAKLCSMEGGGELTASQAKEVLAELLRNGGDPAEIAKAKGFEALSDDALVAAVDQAIADNPADWEAYVGGNDKVMGKFVGLIRKATGGNADGKAVTALLQQRRDGA